MSEPPFREEALAHHRGQAGPGRLLGVAPRWTRVAFWALALAAVGGLIAGSLVKVDRVIFVPASVDGTRISVTLPAETVEKAMRCGRARLVVPGEEAVEVRQMFGALDRIGAVAERPVRGKGGTLRLCVGRRALIADLVPGLGS